MSHLHHRDLIEDLHMQLFAEWETRPEKARLASNAIDAGFKVTSQFPYSPVII
jgi:hypothetical protein